MATDKCERHAEGIWLEDEMHYCEGCGEIVDVTEVCREAMQFVVDAVACSTAGFTSCDGLDVAHHMKAFEEKKRAEA